MSEKVLPAYTVEIVPTQWLRIPGHVLSDE